MMAVIASFFFATSTFLSKILGGGFLGDAIHPLQITHSRFAFGFLGTVIILILFSKNRLTRPHFSLHLGRVILGWIGVSIMFNAMVYIRGHAADYDRWQQMGNPGWSYENVLPYFKKAESFAGDGDPEFHGSDGPLSVKKSERTDDVLMDAFVEAGQQAGFPVTDLEITVPSSVESTIACF